MTKKDRHRQQLGVASATGLLVLAGAVQSALAESWLDTLRELDLNTYALGANLFISSSHYEGIDDFVVVFPAPTKFGSAIDTDDTFFIRDGDFGLRNNFANGWDLGAVLSFQTLGYGSGQSPALAGMSRRDWTIQAGVTAGREVGRYRVDIVAQTDILGEHDGQEYDLKFARLFDRGNYYFMPQIDVTYQSSQLVDHYFGVTAAEALPGRPEYHPGAAITYGGSLEWSWKWHRHWFLTARASIDKVPSEIRNSPVVDKDYTWTAMVGIAYDAPSMVAMRSDRPGVIGAGLEIRIGAFLANSDTKVFLTDGTAIVPVNLETDFSLDDSELTVPLNLTWRINPFHRVEFAYFQLKRNGASDIVVPIDIGDVTFQPGDTVQTSFDTTIYKLGYAFSLMHDAQKELSVFGGAHVSDISYRSASATDAVVADTTAILPVLGADLAVNFAQRLSLEAELEFFVSDVNKYSGNLINFGLSGNYQWHERFSIGAGYRFYRQDIDSADENFSGDYRFEYRGPFLSVSASF